MFLVGNCQSFEGAGWILVHNSSTEVSGDTLFADSPRPPMARNVGRFEIRRLLGKGAQSVVFLAFDPTLEREVAIKTLHFKHRDVAQNQFLLHEARTVGKMRHAHIVPIFEAGEQDGDPYLVFEYVEGQTLAQWIKAEGAMAPERSLEMMRHVLDAVAYAHRFGTIHRDLKPSNILIDSDGKPRVMDFGIACKVAESREGDAALIGTPAYMAPEYVADRFVSPQGDVFAAGLILYEMVFGRRAIAAADVFEALHKVANEQIQFPAEPAVDDRLRQIIAKATARDPTLRYISAQEMLEAIAAYLNPVLGESQSSDERGSQGTLDFLLRRMRHKSDFPALSAAISAINRLASSEKESLNAISNTILKDFALTNKILRLVNSAYYRQAGGGSISTVSRAIVVLGFNAIRSIAISLLLFEHLQNKQHAQVLKEEFLRTNLSAVLAKGLAAKYMARDAEEAFICSLFHNLGRLLTQYYFPEEAETIGRLVAHGSTSEESAAARVLGMTYQELGIGVARNWGFPDLIVHSMRRLPSGDVRAPDSREARLRTVAEFSNDLCDVIGKHAAAEQRRELERLNRRFREAIPLSEKDVQSIVEQAREEITEFCKIVHLNPKQTTIGRQLLQAAPAEAATVARASDNAPVPGTLVDAPTLPGGALAGEDETMTGEDPAERSTMPTFDTQAVLAAGIQDISNSLVEDFSLNDVLRIILETMYRALGFRRVILCVRDLRTQSMNARFGFGEGVEESVKRFRFAVGHGNDIFNVVLAKGVDILISDAAEAHIAARIPDWYRKVITAQTFIVLPLMIKNAPVAMIYADKDRAGEIVISDKELSLLRTLRNQAVLAIKQSS